MKFIGNPTECALLFAAREAGRDYEAARRQTEILHVYPFSSETKYMTTVVKREGKLRFWQREARNGSWSCAA